jgi:hypothetical protein
MNRRGFLASILAAGVAPAAIGSGVLMPIKRIVLPEYLEIVDPTVNALIYATLYPMEIGRYEGFRYITSQQMQELRLLPRPSPMFAGMSSYQFNSK